MQREFVATLDWVQAALDDKDKAQHWARWQKELAPPSELLRTLTFLPFLSTITHLPPLSFVLNIPFRLQKPYISKDECDFHLLDNPLRKEKVFQMPMVAATSWKGALRAALWQSGYKEDSEVTIRLLGNAREREEQQAGRLYFYPTFFDQIRLEVINPHDRRTGVSARGPILIECVPQKARGDLFLLYVPFGPIEQAGKKRRAEVAQDLQTLAEGMQAMLTTYGFGAKTSSGYGTAEDRLDGVGKLVIRAKLAATTDPSPDSRESDDSENRQLLADVEQFVEQFQLDSFPRWTNAELSQKGWGKKRQSKYKRLRNRHPDWSTDAGTWREPSENAVIEEEQIEPPPVTEFTAHTLSELCDLAQRVAIQLREVSKP